MKARPGKPRFKGGFKTFSISISTNREKGTDSRLRVYSQGSRAVVVEYLWLKYLWDELSKDEWRLFYNLSELIDDDIKVSALRAIMIVGKKKVRERLNNMLSHLQMKTFPRELYLGYKRLDVEIQEESRSLPKVPKFSGWIRSASAVGTKSSRGPSHLEPLAIHYDDYSDVKFDWYSFLTVGDTGFFTQSD